MFEVVKTVFLLSCIGGIFVCLLLIIKPLTSKKFPAKWQYIIWLIVACSMVVPAWKIIPQKNAQIITSNFTTETREEIDTAQNATDTGTLIIEDSPIEYDKSKPETAPTAKVNYSDILAYSWLGGMCLYLFSALISYWTFLLRKRKGSFDLLKNEAFESVIAELGIKRKIKVRISNDTSSPMLVGVLFPVVYVPNKSIDKNAEKMIYRHELTHYKHKDLFFKWFVLFVNAIHWFNPFAYLLSSNVSQACEISCDMSVIKELNDSEQKLYMNTILDLIEKKGR